MILKGTLTNGQNHTMVFPDVALEKTVIDFYKAHGKKNISSLYDPETMQEYSATQYDKDWQVEAV